MERRARTLGAAQPRYTEGTVRRHKPDYWLIILAALLLTIGLVVVYSISPGLSSSQGVSQSHFVIKQLIDVALGIAVFFVAAWAPASFWAKFAKPLAITAIVGSLIVLVTPIDAVYQAHRWIRLGSFSFQVAELIKLAILVGLAQFLAKRHKQGAVADFSAAIKPLIILLLLIGVVVAKLQSDLGSAGVMVAMMFVMAYVAGIPLKRVLTIGGLALMLVVIAVSSSGYRRDRLSTFLHPQKDCLTTGYQACQALISVGSGGLIGRGLGYSVQAYGYTPEASNDSIFAIIAEQVGFIGTLILMLIYGAFISRMKRIAERTPDMFQRLIVVGVMTWLAVQMIINIGAMVGLLPLKGITLPFVSQGGTSLVFLTAALGIVFQISRYTSYSVVEPTVKINEPANTNYSFDGRRLRRPHNPSLVARPRA
jgi:cell division protein FtsW